MSAAEDPVEELRRWETSGGHWQVLFDDGHRLDVALTTCDGGEEMSRISSDAPALRDYVAGRSRSEDDAAG